jgi:hypothetical protein
MSEEMTLEEVRRRIQHAVAEAGRYIGEARNQTELAKSSFKDAQALAAEYGLVLHHHAPSAWSLENELFPADPNDWNSSNC